MNCSSYHNNEDKSVDRYYINFDDEMNIEPPDSVDGSVFKKKVKKAKPVGGLSGDVETIGELTMSTRERPESC